MNKCIYKLIYVYLFKLVVSPPPPNTFSNRPTLLFWGCNRKQTPCLGFRAHNKSLSAKDSNMRSCVYNKLEMTEIV